VIFASATAAAIWEENWCDKCFRPDQVAKRVHGEGEGCRVRLFALAANTPPKQIVKNARSGLMQDAFRCTDFQPKPASLRPRAAVVEQEESLFDPLTAVLAPSNQSDTDHQ